MPLLDFQCLECGEKFDKLVSNQNRHQITCVKCGSKELKQIYEGKSLFGQVGGQANPSGCPVKSCSNWNNCH